MTRLNKLINDIEYDFIKQIELNELLVLINTETNNNLKKIDSVLFNKLEFINQQSKIINHLQNTINMYKNILKISILLPFFIILTNYII